MQTLPAMDKKTFIKWSLCQFAGMGANENQLASEYQKMVQDEAYLANIYCFFEEIYEETVF